MRSYFPDDNIPRSFHGSATRPLSSTLAESNPTMPQVKIPITPYSQTPTSSSLGRMPLTPAYAVPMEAEVVTRADFIHVMLRSALGANFLAPVSNPSYILDVGCGSGRWVREMAAEFPTARVVGLDAVAPAEINPAISGAFGPITAPPRYAFVQHNLQQPLTFAPGSFDLTHMRAMAGVLPVAVWPRIMEELARVTAPGGWVELVEPDLVYNGGPALQTMQRWALQTLAPQGIDPRIGGRLGELLQRLSFGEVQSRRIDLPVGPHGGRFGELMGADVLARIEGLRAQMLAARVTTPGAFAQAQTALRQEMARGAYSQPFHIIYGRR